MSILYKTAVAAWQVEEWGGTVWTHHYSFSTNETKNIQSLTATRPRGKSEGPALMVTMLGGTGRNEAHPLQMQALILIPQSNHHICSCFCHFQIHLVVEWEHLDSMRIGQLGSTLRHHQITTSGSCDAISHLTTVDDIRIPQYGSKTVPKVRKRVTVVPVL